ncbi:MAG: DUF3857 domain-containing protein [Myxococcaceae bacterium]|nr:DUF3857 domain-containing protein [Myxococcaceae bacterium]
MSALIVVLGVCLGAGCATTTTHSTDWLSAERLTWDKERYGEAAAVVLFRADRTKLDGLGGTSEVLHHEVIGVLKEGGFDLAEVRVPFSKQQELVVLKARVIQPDGSVRELLAREVLVDTNGKGERDTQAKFFRFPDVRLGSVLEYLWVVRSPWIVPADDQDTLGAFPVREYEFELVGSRQLVLETIEYNSTRPIDVQVLDDGSSRLTFSLKDLPARQPEPWSPHWTFTEPRWAWRVMGMKVSSLVTRDWYRSWSDVVANFARRAWFGPTTFDGFTARPDLSTCRDARCRVDVATSWLQQKTSTLGVDTNRESKLAEAFQSGRASAKERALMLRKVLAEAGVETKLAFTTDRLSRQTAQGFPEWSQLNRLLVYVPAQESIPRALAIDLESEYVRPGQLPPLVLGQPAFVFQEVGLALGDGLTEGAWQTLEGERAGEQHQRLVHQARLEADGTLLDDATLEARGEWAETWQRTHKDSRTEGLKREVGRIAAGTSPLAKHSKSEWTACSGLEGRCGFTWKMRTPRYAVRDGRNWLVPLKALDALYEFFPSAARRQDLHVRSDGFVEELFELETPTGYHPVHLPDVIDATGPGVAVRVAAERTRTGLRLSRRVTFTPTAVSPADSAKFLAALAPFIALRNTVIELEPD